MNIHARAGQVGLILLVVMGVVIALAMSLASRSLSDTVLSRQEQESSVAFRLAESGVESALNSIRTSAPPSGATSQTSGIFSTSYDVEELNSYSLFVREGEIAHLDLIDYDTIANPTLTISWTKTSDQGENRTCSGEGSGNAPAALEIISFQADGSAASFAYYNPAGCTVSGNGFSSSASGSNPYRSQVTYSVPVGIGYLRMRPLYADATVAVSGAGIDKTQLYLIQSQANGGDAKKEIEVKRGLDSAPSVFDFALFSGSTIVK
jgi:Tfp pilus assembly protein PilX